MDIFNDFATNEDAENNGTWFPYGDAELLVARGGNRYYERLMMKLYNENRVVLEGFDTEDDEKIKAADQASDKIMIEVMARTILKGWRGNFKYKGQDLEYSVDNARLVLQHRAFRVKVGEFADDAAAFELKKEVEQGND